MMHQASSARTRLPDRTNSAPALGLETAAHDADGGSGGGGVDDEAAADDDEAGETAHVDGVSRPAMRVLAETSAAQLARMLAALVSFAPVADRGYQSRFGGLGWEIVLQAVGAAGLVDASSVAPVLYRHRPSLILKIPQNSCASTTAAGNAIWPVRSAPCGACDALCGIRPGTI